MNNGPVGLAVLVLLLCAKPHSWTVILGKMSHFQQGDQGEPEVYPGIPQGESPAGDCNAGRGLQAESAGGGL